MVIYRVTATAPSQPSMSGIHADVAAASTVGVITRLATVPDGPAQAGWRPVVAGAGQDAGTLGGRWGPPIFICKTGKFHAGSA